MTMRSLLVAALVAAFLVAGCGGGSTPTPMPAPVAAPARDQAAALAATIASRMKPLSLAAQVGRRMFVDASLSGSGRLSCASCHDPQAAYAPANDLAVQMGGATLAAAGTRAVPSLRYKDATPAYADLLDNPDGISVPGPGGGFTWDGRAATLAEQAQIPLLAANEMANGSAAEVVAALQKGAYAGLFRQAFGERAFADVDTAFRSAGLALQAYQLEDASFHPFTSKFDLYAGNKIGGTLTPAEARGLKVFSDPKGGNCAACHYQGAGLNGGSALFTDFSYEAIGVPRNRAIPANADPRFVDVGLCGPLRADHAPVAGNTFCGMVKTPTLRNVALRKSFFHNGVIHSLEQAIRFYNTRDTWPEIWYPTVGGKAKATADKGFPTYGLITTQYTGGTVRKFDDMPPRFVKNIDTQLPLDGRQRHSQPPLSDGNIADLVCFLKTLTDGYTPGAATADDAACAH